MPDRELSESLRARIVETLGLPADADSDTINAAIENHFAQNAERAIAKAISNGAILPAHRDYWIKAFKKDQTGTEAVLASLTPRRTTPASTTLNATSLTETQEEQYKAAAHAMGLGDVAQPQAKWVPESLRHEGGSPYTPNQFMEKQLGQPINRSTWD